MIKTYQLKVCLVITIILASGCVSTPTKGDKMLVQGETAQDLAEKWNKGNSLFIEGEKLMKKGKKMIEEGQEKIDEGKDDMEEGKDTIEDAEEMISEGKHMMEQSEQAFTEKFPNFDSKK